MNKKNALKLLLAWYLLVLILYVYKSDYISINWANVGYFILVLGIPYSIYKEERDKK